MIHFSNCPVCKSSAVHPSFTAKDYTVTKEDFSVWECDNCTLRFTQDIPSQNEIGKYYQSSNYVSHSDTQEGLINRLYHQVRKRTLHQKRDLIKKETGSETGSILDVGAGTGAFLDTMRAASWSITGVEPDEIARKNADKLYGIQFHSADQIFTLPLNSFDAITAWHVVEHVHQLHEYIEQFKKMIKPAGSIFIAVPNYTSADAGNYKNVWAAYDVPRHLYHFSPKSMEALLQTHGLKVRKMLPMWFDSYYVSMLSEQYKNGKGNIVKAFFNGLKSNAVALLDRKKCSSVIYVIERNVN